MNESGIEISESKLEDFIYNHLTKKQYCGNLLDIYEDYGGDGLSVYRQFNIGNYGVIDLITFDNEIDCLNIKIYELKKGEIDESALIQILRYKKGIEEICQENGITRTHIECVLIGGSFSYNKDFSIGVSAIPFIEVFTYGLCPLSGISIESHNVTYQDTATPKKTCDIFKCLEFKFHDIICRYYNYQKSEG